MNVMASGPLENFLYNFCNPYKPFKEEKIPYIQKDFSVRKRDRLITFLESASKKSPSGCLGRVWPIVQIVAECAIRFLVACFGLQRGNLIHPKLARRFICFVRDQKLSLAGVFKGQEGRLRYEIFEKNFEKIWNAAQCEITPKDEKVFSYIKPSKDNVPLLIDQRIQGVKERIDELQTVLKKLEANREEMALDPLLNMRGKYQEFLERYRASEHSFVNSSNSANLGEQKLGDLASIRHIVISGGGAKGAVLPSAFRTLLKKVPECMERVENILGSSVGAITAALVATGISREELRDLAGVNFDSLLGRGPILKDGEKLILFLRECIRINILEKLSEMPSEMREQFKQRNPRMHDLIMEQLQKPLVENSQITFRMLSYLREIDPKFFKHLTVTATKKEGGQFIFSENNTPDFDIALACRASASIPIIFSPVTIELPSGEVLTLFDAGLVDNVLVALVETKEKNAFDETLVLVFEEELQEGELSIFHPHNPTPPYTANWIDQLVRDKAPAALTGLRLEKPNTQTKAEVLNHIKKNYRHILSFPVDITTTKFTKAYWHFRKYAKVGKKTTKNFLSAYGVA